MHGPAPPCPPAPQPSPPLGPPPFPTSPAAPNDVPPRAPPDPADPPIDGGPHIPLAAQGAPRFKQARLDSPPILLAPWPSPPPQPSPLQTFHHSRLLAPSSRPPSLAFSRSLLASSARRQSSSPPAPALLSNHRSHKPPAARAYSLPLLHVFHIRLLSAFALVSSRPSPVTPSPPPSLPPFCPCLPPSLILHGFPLSALSLPLSLPA